MELDAVKPTFREPHKQVRHHYTMCGIFGYVGTQPASPILIDALRVLEYRGYDSAGIYIPSVGVFKTVGPVETLAQSLPPVISGNAGIGHTRWATHGAPTEKNAHPHHDQTGRVWLVHNGIIENHAELKERLTALGHTFESETDTEVLAHLIGLYCEESHDVEKATIKALKEVRGTYGIAVMCTDEPEKILTARMGSPIVLGIAQGECFVASDTAPLLRHTDKIIYLDDGEYAILTPAGCQVYSFKHELLHKKPETVELSVEDTQKGGHPHFMLKEILEIPEVLENTGRGRILTKGGTSKLGGLDAHLDEIRALERLVIVGCGSAYYAGLVGRLMIEEYAGIPVQVELGSEYPHHRHFHDEHTALLAISQSGETADTLTAVRDAKQVGTRTIGVVNVVGSSIARETDMGVYNHAGPEIGVASTKAFISQLEVLAMFALFLGRARGLSEAHGTEFALELKALPAKVRTILARRKRIKTIAEDYLGYDDFLYVGRGYNMPTAYEGALKLKEVSYVHAEGYGAGEMKHGPIAMIDDIFPTLAVMPSDSTYEKMRSNVAEIRARNGHVIGIATEGNAEAEGLVDEVIYIPDTKPALIPILASVPLQLFAYYMGTMRGFNVDRPRNLAKSVTVE